MKKILLFSALVLITGILMAGGSLAQEISGTGTIKFYSFEGGFWGLVSDDNNNYLPGNLSSEFKVENLKVSFKGKVLEDVMTTQNWGTPVKITSMTLVGKENSNGYEVHEWGVLDGCITGDNFFLTSRPERTMLIKQPVMYFYFNKKEPFKVEANFLTGKPTDTYPQAEIKDNKVIWDNVSFEKEKEFKTKSVNPMDFVPIREIIPILNNVDADEIIYKGEKSRFLFYEGEMSFKNNISVSNNDGNVTFTNNGSYTVYCINYVNAGNLYWINGKEGEYYFLDSLQAGETTAAKKTTVPSNQNPISEDMKSLGFKDKEVGSFMELWKSPLYFPGNHGHRANISYRIPNEVYNSIISLDFNPVPDKIVRVLYVLIHLDR